MNRDDIFHAVQKRLAESRWKHTLGVAETAVRLANRYGGDAGKADLAALLHDVAKNWPVAEQERVLREHGASPDLFDYDKELWHAPVGALVAKRDFAVYDEEILNAIRWHTSGREGMSQLDKIICLADYIEPGRSYPGVDRIRELAEHSLEEALVAGFDGTIRFLLEKGKKIYPLTVAARNSLLDEIAQRKMQGG
ncbi:MAG TPA: bis(5'-nucleosyl)-tetraphosphatase (symmetrical) YqeK [Bacilli bacterium]